MKNNSIISLSLFAGLFAYAAFAGAQSTTSENAANLRAIDSIPANTLVVYPAAHAKHTVYVFTDVDCFYCRKFHHQVPELNAAGVTVKYFAFPREKNSPDYEKMVAVWCSKNKAEALSEAKSGQQVAMGDHCEKAAKIIESHIDLALHLRVDGTPIIFLDNGQMVDGYAPADELLRLLNTES